MNQVDKPEGDLISSESTHPAAVEQVKNIRNTQPGEEAQVGKETVGQGQPRTQAVQNEESLPATAVPVEQNFSATDQFYDPATGTLENKSGGAKA